MKVILAEKPSVARDIARVVGASGKNNGWLEGGGYQVTWAYGHLVTIAEPRVMCKAWGGKWHFDQLPMIPETFQLTTYERGRKQFDVISRLFGQCDEIINATDAGREGELIFRWIYQHSGCTTTFKRLWISDLTDASIKKGLQEIHHGQAFDHLAYSAQCRAYADWMVGLNATRAYSVRYGQLYTVGRVQTPTLALIVNRFHLIKDFKKFYYYELYAHTRKVAFRWEDADGYKIDKKEKAEKLKECLDGQPGTITDIKKSKKKTGPPPLYDLTLLQKECNEKFGYTAKTTLEYAQALYEKNKLITYPRTESRHLSEEMRPELPDILRSAPEDLKPFADEALARLDAGHKLGKNYIDDKKLTDHHAIIPTKKKLSGPLAAHLRNVYDLVQRRFIAVFHPDFKEDVTEITMHIEQERFKFKGAVPVESGWKKIYPSKGAVDLKSALSVDDKRKENKPAYRLPVKPDVQRMLEAKFKKGQVTDINELEIREKETTPPKIYTDGTLLNAMRYIGRQVDDESLAAHLKDQGLGTQATRAAIIERLIKSEYIFRKGKGIYPTEKGVKLIATVVADLKSPQMTAEWERKLSDIQDGKLDHAAFMREIQAFTQNIIPIIKRVSLKESFGACPQCREGDMHEGRKAFYCSRYKEGCSFVLWATVASKKLPHDQVRKILKDGRSDFISGFKAKTGRLFDAIIELDKEYKTKFCFKK
ncbi:MAG: DNA topoisomerase 3 [Candidatus Omnitrophica bacterium]|nr:DNA topoisomerase 3 [Candidatus Omnitrophota bacterium]